MDDGPVTTEFLPDALEGTLDLSILTTLKRGPMHGDAIATHIHSISDEALRIEEGSLLPGTASHGRGRVVYHTTGWYDSWTGPVANLNHVQLRNTKKSLQRLIVGPWTHSAEFLSYAGEAQFADDAGVDLAGMHLAWYNRFLKGVENGVERQSPVRIYVMGGGDAHKTPEGRVFVGGHWRDEPEWPLARAIPTPYYLHRGGLLARDRPGNADAVHPSHIVLPIIPAP